MFIKTKPVVVDFNTGKPTQYSVSVVGIAPHKTFYVEKIMGYTQDKQQAPEIVGEAFIREISQKAYSILAQEFDHDTVCKMLAAGEGINIPAIPGVTAPGTWQNPRYSTKNKGMHA